MCLCVHSVMLWCPLRFSQKKLCLVRLYLQLFVGGLVSYLRYLGLFAHSGVQHTLWYFCIVYAMLPASLDCPFLIALSGFSNVHFLTDLLLTEKLLIQGYVASWLKLPLQKLFDSSSWTGWSLWNINFLNGFSPITQIVLSLIVEYTFTWHGYMSNTTGVL